MNKIQSFNKFLKPLNTVLIRNVSVNVESNFEEEYRKNHIETNLFQKALLSVGAAAASITDPTRADMIACLGETTGEKAAKYILGKMESSEEGSQILSDQPRINSKTIDLDYLSKLPSNTLGRHYVNFLKINNVTPDSRDPVRFMDDPQLAYVIQRYREVHDLFHTVLQMRTNMLGEVTVKWVEAIQTKLPMCIAGAIFGPVRLKQKHRAIYLNQYLPWAIETGQKSNFLLNIYYEKRWEQPIDEFYEEINVSPLTLVFDRVNVDK
ncbi:unnamed protein product [Phyllotreta striolata]|uniref:Ubiquinone biosynthesis protein COQ4 homolog, mitochondrial n=1 Tax=Phyllotreta striolata TaxID=444603 RepID=A0A9N9XM30_PHYSR|nr:unnamed protein product [Phyllotreta striolata]